MKFVRFEENRVWTIDRVRSNLASLTIERKIGSLLLFYFLIRRRFIYSQFHHISRSISALFELMVHLNVVSNGV